jgi:uncharacterized flavoprotein (TIGR03862 family)
MLSTPPRPHLAIVGAGPAGLRAAEIAAAIGAQVTIFDAKPSVGRKFLVAGRGGLNLTKDEPAALFASHYSGPGQPPDFWPALIGKFDPEAVRAWAADLETETFAASTGRIYPRDLKAAPLLVRWVQRLRKLGVHFALDHRWTGLEPGTPLRLTFQTPDGQRTAETDAVILALGGGSWPDTGSDGSWVETLARLGIAVAPLQAANCGWETPWPASVLAAAEGHPLKSIAARVGTVEVRGELLITSYGLEGGALYQLGPALRATSAPALTIDFKPAHSVEQLITKMGPVRRNLLPEARKRWRLSDAAHALLAAREPFSTLAFLAETTKACTLQLTGARPLAEAISTAGGVRWEELDAHLMFRRVPGVFVAGEMIDWEAPTGGYLIHGCLATGGHAAESALQWLLLNPSPRRAAAPGSPQPG